MDVIFLVDSTHIAQQINVLCFVIEDPNMRLMQVSAMQVSWMQSEHH